jgi:hypothetical protein
MQNVWLHTNDTHVDMAKFYKSQIGPNDYKQYEQFEIVTM